MPDPQSTIFVFSGFVEADRAKTLLESKDISAILIETESSPFVNTTDVVHLRVAESDASQALAILVAEGRIPAPADSDPDIGLPGAGDTTCRCPNCGRTYSTEYDFCPYCEPPADWLAAAIPKRPGLGHRVWLADEMDVVATRASNDEETRVRLAEWALYAALAGLCIWPLEFVTLTLIGILCAAYTGSKMRPGSWIIVTMSAIISAIEVLVLAFTIWSFWQRLMP
jgi:hypothetical protein